MRTEPGGGELVETDRHANRVRLAERLRRRRAARGRWAGVTTPLLPNGQLGWIRLDSERLSAGWTRLSIVVDLSDRSADAAQGRRGEARFAVTVGAPGSDDADRALRGHRHLRGDLDPGLRLLRASRSARPSRTCRPAGSAAGGSRSTAPPARSASPPRTAACAPPTPTSPSWSSTVPLGTPVFIRA